MKIYRNLENVRDLRGSVATIGSFDGYHAGHREIIGTLKEAAAKHNTQSTVITLYPHPRTVLGNGGDALYMITTLREKIYILEKAGVDNLLILEFTPGFASLSYNSFVEDYLVSMLGVKAVIVGYNHHFGKDREGSYEMLCDLGRKHGFEVYRVERYAVDENKISSNTIRDLVLKGELDTANKYLVYPYFVMGDLTDGVVPIKEDCKIAPPSGLYSAYLILSDGKKAFIEDIYLSVNREIVFPKEVMDFPDVRVEIIQRK